MMRPGEPAMLALKRRVLAFAAERRWVLTGGWAHHFAVRGTAGRPSAGPSAGPSAAFEPIYDVTRACRMSDVDAYVEGDPLADLVKLADLVRREHGMKASVNCGMAPNLYTLSVDTGVGREALVDAVGLTRPTFALLPAVLVPDPTPAPGLRVAAPSFELAKLYFMVDNAYELQNSSIEGRMRRVALLERAMGVVTRRSGSRGSSSRTASATLMPPLVIEAIRARPGVAASFATVPGSPGGLDLVVPASGAAELIAALANAAGGEKITFDIHCPMVLVANYSAIVDIVSRPASGSGSGKRRHVLLFVLSGPVPLSNASTSPTSPTSPRFALANLYASAMWCAGLGDTRGATERLAAFERGLATLPRRTGVATRYVGAGEMDGSVDSAYATHLRRRARKLASCQVTYQTSTPDPPRASSRASGQSQNAPAPGSAFLAMMRNRNVRGVSIQALDGRRLVSLTPEALRTPERVLEAFATVLPDNILTAPLVAPPGRRRSTAASPRP